MNTRPDRPMQMSESEACHRLCPQGLSEERKCRGAYCMAWRWVGKAMEGQESRGFCGMSPHFPSR